MLLEISGYMPHNFYIWFSHNFRLITPLYWSEQPLKKILSQDAIRPHKSIWRLLYPNIPLVEACHVTAFSAVISWDVVLWSPLGLVVREKMAGQEMGQEYLGRKSNIRTKQLKLNLIKKQLWQKYSIYDLLLKTVFPTIFFYLRPLGAL